MLVNCVHTMRGLISPFLYKLLVQIFKFRCKLFSSPQSSTIWPALAEQAQELIRDLFRWDSKYWDKSIVHMLIEITTRDGPLW